MREEGPGLGEGELSEWIPSGKVFVWEAPALPMARVANSAEVPIGAGPDGGVRWGGEDDEETGEECEKPADPVGDAPL